MIAVTGTGRVTAQPDVVRVRVVATVLRPTVAEAIAAAGAGVTAMRAALARNDVNGGDAASGTFTVGPEQTWTPDGRPQVTGYRCEHELRVVVRDLGAVGRVLGDLVGAGGDDVRLDGVEPALEDAAPLRVRARDLAWGDALERATRLAALAGRALGPVRQIVEDGAEPPRPLAAVAAFGEETARGKVGDVGVRPGEVAVTVGLSVQFDLGEPC